MPPVNVEKGSFSWAGGTVTGFWHHPARGETYFLLGHGAGSNLYTPSLVRIAEALAAAGVGVVRFNFPYAEARRKVPDPQPRLESCCRAVAQQVAERAGRLLLGGRSMGGRIASHVVADGFSAAGLIFFAYPLHPPGQPEKIRDAHLSRITVPMLFLQGSRDPFARPDLLAKTVRRLPTARLHVVQDGDHGLAVRGRSPAEVLGELVEAVTHWIARLPGGNRPGVGR